MGKNPKTWEEVVKGACLPKGPRPVRPIRPDDLLEEESRLWGELKNLFSPDIWIATEGPEMRKDRVTGDILGGRMVVIRAVPGRRTEVVTQRWAPGSEGSSPDGKGIRTYGSGWTDNGPPRPPETEEEKAAAEEIAKALEEATEARRALEDRGKEVDWELSKYRAAIKKYREEREAWVASATSPEEFLGALLTEWEGDPNFLRQTVEGEFPNLRNERVTFPLTQEERPLDGFQSEEVREFHSQLPRWGREFRGKYPTERDAEEAVGGILSAVKKRGRGEEFSSLVETWGVAKVTDPWEMAAAVEYLYSLLEW